MTQIAPPGDQPPDMEKLLAIADNFELRVEHLPKILSLLLDRAHQEG
jgi:hypothetical protein